MVTTTPYYNHVIIASKDFSLHAVFLSSKKYFISINFFLQVPTVYFQIFQYPLVVVELSFMQK